MKINFDCVDDMNKLDKSLKAINSEGRDHLIIHIKCKHYIGIWGGVRNGE
jgi:hypothetical protein